MRSARLLKVENRLGELVRRPGGRRVTELLKAAETRVASKHDELILVLPAAALRLKATADSARDAPEATLEDLYVESNQLFALAAALGLSTLAEAAYGLCDLVDSFRATGRVGWEAVDVHVDAIRMLASNPGSDAAQAQVTAGLRQVGARYLEG